MRPAPSDTLGRSAGPRLREVRGLEPGGSRCDSTPRGAFRAPLDHEWASSLPAAGPGEGRREKGARSAPAAPWTPARAPGSNPDSASRPGPWPARASTLRRPRPCCASGYLGGPSLGTEAVNSFSPRGEGNFGLSPSADPSDTPTPDSRRAHRRGASSVFVSTRGATPRRVRGRFSSSPRRLSSVPENFSLKFQNIPSFFPPPP